MVPKLPLMLTVFSAPFHAYYYIHLCNRKDVGVLIVVHLFVANVCITLSSALNIINSFPVSPLWVINS